VTELGRKLESQGSKPIRYHLRVGSTTYVRLPENSRGVLMIHDVDFLLTRLRTADPGLPVDFAATLFAFLPL